MKIDIVYFAWVILQICFYIATVKVVMKWLFHYFQHKSHYYGIYTTKPAEELNSIQTNNFLNSMKFT